MQVERASPPRGANEENDNTKNEEGVLPERSRLKLAFIGRCAVGLLLFSLVLGSVVLSKLSLIGLAERLGNLTMSEDSDSEVKITACMYK